jgi:uncharacterized protein YukE
MRDQFPWHFDPSDQELQRLWDRATFSPDANVLLQLYRVDSQTRDDLFSIYEELSDRLFLANEAANQFFQNRRGVIRKELASFDEARERIENWAKRRQDFEDIKGKLASDPVGHIISSEIRKVYEDRDGYSGRVKDLKEDLLEAVDQLEKEYQPTDTTEATPTKDPILKRLVSLFNGRTGEELEDEWDDLKQEARKRYSRERPPGYKDFSDGDEVTRGEIEDYVIWRQLMTKATKEGVDIVFVTNEKKPDWWDKDDDHNLVRPRHELLQEFRNKTGQRFWMLHYEEFIETAGERLDIDISQESVDQASQASKAEAEGKTWVSRLFGEESEDGTYGVQGSLDLNYSTSEKQLDTNKYLEKYLNNNYEVDDISNKLRNIIYNHRPKNINYVEIKYIMEYIIRSLESISSKYNINTRGHLSIMKVISNRVIDLYISNELDEAYQQATTFLDKYERVSAFIKNNIDNRARGDDV